MPHEVIMPALGMSQDTGLVVAWHKAKGDQVKASDVLMEVETDKSTMEVEAGADGWLTDVRAEEGADVPVGDVVAVISETADAPSEAPADHKDDAPAPTAEAPAGHEVIMPALGMSQDTGQIVAWLKARGDAVKAGDALLEVETDKTTMEVEAGADGYVAALNYEAGADVPVGDVIAVISAGKPAAGAAPAPAKAAAAKPAAEKTQTPAPAAPDKAARAPDQPARPSPAPAPGGRVLASPKAKRLAAERGIDLAALAGQVGQPIHAADLDRYQPPAAATAAGPALPDRLEARADTAALDGFTAFAAEHGAGDRTLILAAFAAGALRAASGAEHVAVGISAPGRAARRLTDPDLCGLSEIAVEEAEDHADLILRDLTATRVRTMRTGGDAGPVLIVARGPAGGLDLTLEAPAGALTSDLAVALLDGVAARIEAPLRQLY